MAHQKSDRLWKIEDSSTKLEIYAVGYASEPKLDQLRCDVLVTARHFSGAYQTLIGWGDAIRFATECKTLAIEIGKSPGSPPAQRDLPHASPSLSISVAPSVSLAPRPELVWVGNCKTR